MVIASLEGVGWPTAPRHAEMFLDTLDHLTGGQRRGLRESGERGSGKTGRDSGELATGEFSQARF